MRFTRRIVAAALGLLVMTVGAHRCSAQDPLPSVVQLPTFQFFGFSGTVVVPDSGAGFLGGNKSASMGSSRRGLNRSFGLIQGNSQASIHAQIIDLNEMDEQLLGGTPQEFLSRTGDIARREQALAAHERRVREASDRTVDPDKEGKALVRYARRLYQQGHETASFDTYRMAIGALRSGRLRELAKVEFRRVFGTAADQSLRMASLQR